MANQKLTQEELDKLQELQQKNAALVNELGGISLAEINISEDFKLMIKGKVSKKYLN